ncbi:hypothetical protein SAMN05421771_0134 [Granulicella pectinivorans]|uniref:Uncharacterized protein n=1 Tax=Granulicella pectinivorans TaxID=474950 RepID=A0A1I6L1W9_9BACT|nr:hypothetical protein [Granulicella pectinivorans]SFR97464.1 hypothetical protein SAMN05421771_0134 [Granulicella pectinivorans]
MTDLLFLPKKNPIQRVNAKLLARLRSAQDDHLFKEFGTSADLLDKVFADLKLAISAPAELSDSPSAHLADMDFRNLIELVSTILQSSGLPNESITQQAALVSQRLQLVAAFSDPNAVLTRVTKKVTDIVRTFPKTEKDIECGRNPGDVLDPYILAASQILLHGGDFEKAIETTVGHKAIMIIEGLLGHLHEDIVGEMRGNVRVPEPRGTHQEMLDLETNPFPGADVVQPPFDTNSQLRFHQVKSKTGSAKGGDGKRLGEQLKRLQDYYGGSIFYDALIGNTLRGHRSRSGVERAAPGVVVLVGDAAFRELTRRAVGPQLLLRLYQASFQQVADESGYRVETMASAIVMAFSARALAAGDSFVETVLDASTKGPVEFQDSRANSKIVDTI